MLTVRLNKKAILCDILSNLDSGLIQPFIVKLDSNKSLDKIVAYASILQKEGNRVFIEVQFQSKYTPRPKRIEILELSQGNINLYKFTSPNKFDKDAIELDKIATEIKEAYPNLADKIYSYILLDEYEKIDFINHTIVDMGLKVKAKTI